MEVPTGQDIAELIETTIDSLPDDAARMLHFAIGDVLLWRERVGEAPVFIRVLIAEVISRQLVKIVKNSGQDSLQARRLVLLLLRWAFRLDDTWAPKRLMSVPE